MALSGPKMATREGFTRLGSPLGRRPASPSLRIEIEQSIKGSSLDAEDALEHSVGCPKYKATSKSKVRASNLHPKPWGARDPKLIPCTCSSRKRQNSAPSSVSHSPVRGARRRSPKSPLRSLVKEADTTEEVEKLLDEFCTQVEEKGLKLCSTTLDLMFIKMRKRLEVTPSEAQDPSQAHTGVNKMKLRESRKTADENEKRQKSQNDSQTQRSHSQQSQRTGSAPPVNTFRGNVETNNVVLELAQSDNIEPEIPFSNIFGSLLPPDRFKYVTLGREQFFGTGEILAPQLPAATVFTIDSTSDVFLPMPDVVIPPRMARPSGRSPPPTRRR